MMHVLIGIALKSLLVAGIALGLLELMKRRSPAERSWVAHAGLFALVLVAVAPLAMPNWIVEAPALAGTAQTAQAPVESAFIAPAPAAAAKPNASQAKDATAKTALAAPPVATSTLGPIATTIAVYAIPAAILLFITFLALARLVALRARADVLVDAHWLSALARAQRRMGFKHGTALLISDELASPISWGLMRPVILLNTRAVEAAGEAEAIIAHELAHVARMDWAKLLLARVATALFWFNPLVWLLAREAHQLREEAADDAVLAADIPDTDYAQLLVGVARHECPGLLLGAHGVAPSKSSLARRVARVLDAKIARGPVAGSFGAGVFVGAIVIAAPLAALTLVPNGTAAELKQAAAVSAAQKAEGLSPYYPGTTPTDLPSIISQGVATSVESAVAAINPRVSIGEDEADREPKSALDRAIEMKAIGVTPQYLAEVKAASPSLRGADLDEIVGMKAVGVTPDFIRNMAAVGFPNLDVDELTEAKAIGLTGAFIRAMKAKGYSGDLDDYVQMRAVGVTPGYAEQFKKSGYNVTVEKLVELKAQNVDIEDLRNPVQPPRPPQPPRADPDDDGG